MKLKFYNPDTTPATGSHNPSKPVVRLNKNGSFTFNMAAAVVLGLKDGATIHVTQDEENPKDWYLVADDVEKKGFPVRATKTFKSGPGGYIFSASHAAKALLQSLGIADHKAGFLIASEPEHVDSAVEKGVKVRVFAILTSARK